MLKDFSIDVVYVSHCNPCYLHDMRNPQQKSSTADHQHQYLLQSEVLQQRFTVAIHQTGYHDLHHCKLGSQQQTSKCQKKNMHTE